MGLALLAQHGSEHEKNKDGCKRRFSSLSNILLVTEGGISRMAPCPCHEEEVGLGRKYFRARTSVIRTGSLGLRRRRQWNQVCQDNKSFFKTVIC